MTIPALSYRDAATQTRAALKRLFGIDLHYRAACEPRWGWVPQRRTTSRDIDDDYSQVYTVGMLSNRATADLRTDRGHPE